MAYLRERGIGCAVHYPIPLPRQPLYAGVATCPVAEALAASVLSIPVHPNVTDEERAYVARMISMDAGVIGTGTMGRNHARVYSRAQGGRDDLHLRPEHEGR